jgi:cob(I)alamin adenosyltransferase
MTKKPGLVYIFEGNGKGKTSAALGVVCRMLMLRKKVVWISWYKNSLWKLSEMGMSKKFKKDLEMYWMGDGFFLGNTKKVSIVNGNILHDIDTLEGHKKSAEKALLLAKEVLMKNEEGGGMGVDLLVLDEVIRAVSDGLLAVGDILSLIKSRGSTHMVLTGHKHIKELDEYADLVTYMKKIKHPYDKGILAVSGLDF